MGEVSRCLRPGGVLLLEEHEVSTYTSLVFLFTFHAELSSDPASQDHDIHQTEICSLVSTPRFQLELVQRRNEAHVKNMFPPGTNIHERLSWGREMGRRVRETEGFVGGDASVEDVSFDLGFGSNPNEREHLSPPFGLSFREAANLRMSLGVDETDFFPSSFPASPKTQRGSLVRDAWLAGWELHSALIPGMDEKLMEELKQLDRQIFPEDDVGLFFRWRVVWAMKRSS